jgi:pseudouridine-5'-phosphate glycosidase
VKGVTPATIAVRDGICRVGLTCEELADLAKAGEEGRATKCSTRELSLFIANSFRNVDKEGHQWGGRYFMI